MILTVPPHGETVDVEPDAIVDHYRGGVSFLLRDASPGDLVFVHPDRWPAYVGRVQVRQLERHGGALRAAR